MEFFIAPILTFVVLVTFILSYNKGYKDAKKFQPHGNAPKVSTNKCLKEFCECKHPTSKIEMVITKCVECNKIVEN